MNRHRQKLYDYLTGDTHIKLSRRERAKLRRMQERRINRKRVATGVVYLTYPVHRSDGTHEYTPDAPAYYGDKYRDFKHVRYWGVEAAQDDNFALKA